MPKDDSHLYEYTRLGGVMTRVEKPLSSFQEPAKAKPTKKKSHKPLHIIQEETSQPQSSLAPLYTDPALIKSVWVYVDKDIEFNVEISP